MTIKNPQTPSRFKDVEDFQKDVHDNLSFEDVKLVNPSTSVPTTDTLEKGKSTLREISGVPTLYVRGTNGTIYNLATGVAI